MRRRLIAFWLAAVLLFTAGGGFFIYLSRRSPGGELFPAGEVLVQPGDTLWSIAVRAVPEKDPREIIDWICRTNRLSTLTIRPGQRLVIPKILQIKGNELARLEP